MSVLVDTNVLLRQLQPTFSQYRAAIDSVARFLDAGEVVYFTPQNIAEFFSRYGEFCCPKRTFYDTFLF